MKFKKHQVETLKRKGLWEGFLDRLKKDIKRLTARDLDRITNRHNKEMADFLKRVKKDLK